VEEAAVLVSLLLTVRGCVRSRAALQLEVLALRHQLHVMERSRVRRLPLSRTDRLLWVWFSRVWSEWRAALVIVKPETVIAWHRQGIRLFGRGTAVAASGARPCHRKSAR
jgi:hypothetical protein